MGDTYHPTAMAGGTVPGPLCALILRALAHLTPCRAPGRVAWAVFGWCFSLVGVLTFVAYHFPSVRERCAACGKKRPVHIEACPFCGAPFPPPELKGTEIFA